MKAYSEFKLSTCLHSIGLDTKNNLLSPDALPAVSIEVDSTVHRIASFLGFLFRQLGISGGASVCHIADWGLYLNPELSVIKAVRAGNGAHETLRETPVHLFSKDELDLSVGMFSLTVGFLWSASLIMKHKGKPMVIRNWEGEYLDFWCDEECANGIKSIASDYSYPLAKMEEHGDGSLDGSLKGAEPPASKP